MKMLAHEDMDHRREVFPKLVQIHSQTDDWNIEKQNSTDVRDTGLQGDLNHSSWDGIGKTVQDQNVGLSS